MLEIDLRIPVEKRSWLNKNIGRSIGALLAHALLLYDSMTEWGACHLGNGCWAESYNPQMSLIGNIRVYLLICHYTAPDLLPFTVCVLQKCVPTTSDL